MTVYCPNCGQANETRPGARVTCTACTAGFDAPPESWQPPVPNHGTPTNTVGPQVTNTLAVVSLIAGVACCIPVLSPLTAIIAGGIAILQINANPETQKGKGLAVAGIVLGSLIGLLSILSLIGSMAGAAASSD